MTRASLLRGLALVFAAGIVLPPAAEPAAVPDGPEGPSGVAESGEAWPGFRGPGGLGHAVHANPPQTWNLESGTNFRWKTLIPKPGMSSPVVWENQVFLTGADEMCRRIYCYAADTGALLWHHDADGIPGSPPMESLPFVLDETGYASPTAATNGRHLAALFGTGDLVCVTLDGKRVWAKNLGVPDNHYGHATSLLCDPHLLFVQYDQAKNSTLFAFDLATGERVWQVKRDAISWSSPILVQNNGRSELILTNSEAVDSYDPKTGKLLWHVKCLEGEVAPSAAYADGRVFVTGEAAAVSAIDIADHGSTPALRWSWDEILPDAASLVASSTYVIVPTPYGIVNCLDARTGRSFWEHEFDEGFYSSPVVVEDRVYLIDLDGAMHVFKMDDEFESLGTSTIGEPVYATPAISGNRTFIRGLTHLYCFERTD